jgi:hypothetical protein
VFLRFPQSIAMRMWTILMTLLVLFIYRVVYIIILNMDNSEFAKNAHMYSSVAYTFPLLFIL